MKRKGFSILFALVLVLGLSMVTAAPVGAADSTFTFPGGSLTTTDTSSWGGYNSHSYGPHFNVDAGPLTIEYLGVNAYPINYTGDFGWPPDPTDTGASVIVGVGNGINIAQYSFKSNMSGNKPRGTDPETYGKGSWDHQNIGHWNDDGYRSYLFQGQFTDNWVATVGNSQYNAEKHGGPTGNDPDYDTFDFKFYVEKVAPNTYEVTGWHNLWKSSAIDEGCYWDWNYAKNAHDAAKRGYLKCFEGTWTADGGLDLSDVQVFLGIQNWQGTQPELHNFDWDGVVVTGTFIPPDEVWVDDNWVGSSPGDLVDGHTFGYDAFATIQDGIDNVAGSTVHVAAGTYVERLVIGKQLNLQGAGSATTIIDATGGTPGIMLTAGGDSESQRLTIKGLTVRNSTLDGIRAYKKAGEINLSLCYITLEDVILTLNGAKGMEIHNDTIVSDLEIKDCEFVNNAAQGLRTASNVIVDGMTITDSKFNGNSYGIYLQGTINGVTILGSEFNSNVGYGGYMTETGPLSNLMIEGSQFNGNYYGLVVWNERDNTDITIRGSSFQDNDKGGIWMVGDNLTNVLVEKCEVLNNDVLDSGVYGITFGAYTNVMTNVAVHFTNIDGQTGGIENYSLVDTAIVDATLNWWGDVSGPYHPTSWYYYGLEITNPDGQGAAVTDYVLYEPWIGQEGMATGGGWFIPEASSAHGLVNLGGKATFGFVAKQKDETSSGQLEFQYHADELNLKSTSYDWVSVASVQVMFEGEGLLNGVSGYRFRVWAFDGDKAGGQPDHFTIRIWTGSDSYKSPTYRAEGNLGGGQIVVRKK